MQNLLWLALLICFGPQDKPAEKPTAAKTATAADKAMLHIPVEAVFVENDDEQLPCPTTADEVKKWLADANALYKPAKIQFDFTGDASDCFNLKSTRLNRLVGPQNSDYAEAIQEGNAVAAKCPDKMTLILRHGASIIPATQGLASIEFDFVLLPPFANALVSHHQDIHYAAQQIGRYLGLKPTAARNFITTPEAEQFLREHKDDPNCFDGDGIKDTPPDPYIVALTAAGPPAPPVTLNGADFTPPTGNLMADYDAPKALSPTQMQWAQWGAKTRAKSRFGTPTNLAETPPVKADTLKITAKNGCETSVQKLTTWNAARWNDGSQLLCAAKKGGSLTLEFSVADEGEYRIDLYATQAPDFGIVKASLDDKPLGEPMDGWAPYVMPTGKLELGKAKLKKGMHRIRFEAADKRDLSTDYHFGLDGLRVTPVEK